MSNGPTTPAPGLLRSQPTGADNQLARICGEVAAVFKRTSGGGPVRTTAHWAGPNVLVVLLENGQTEAEQMMRRAGHIDKLCDRRRLLQALIENELNTTVERILSRPVETMLSATRLDPDVSAEIFLLRRDGTEGSSTGEPPTPGNRACRMHAQTCDARAAATWSRQA
jgi:uncharacterized protein YbcI